MVGAPKGDPVPIDWTGQALGAGDDHRPDRRLADRPLRRPADDRRRPRRLRAVRPARRRRPAPQRQLVVLPTNTWQAYNMYDRDGDGWGDTWYAGGNPPVELDRPYRDRGVPPRFKALRPRVPPLARCARGRRPTWSPTTTSRPFALGRRPARALRPRRLPGAQRVHDRRTPTTSSSASATSAAGSSSSRRTTSSGGSTSRARRCAGSGSGATRAGPRRA